ncbi:hypothetical protein ZWY2020_039242, partial [Hordeum vulgare]
REMNLISKVFTAEKMNHAKTQGGPRGLHNWRSGKGLGCYQGDPNGVCSLSNSYTSYVGEMMIPCQLGTFSEFVSNAFQFHGLIAKNNHSKKLKSLCNRRVSETLILRRRLSVLYTKCIEFLCKPLYFLAHAMW